MPPVAETAPPRVAASVTPAGNAAALPDVAVHTPAAVRRRLDRAGMADIEACVRVAVDGTPTLLPATADAFVSLDDPHARGIHMSRLYLRVQRSLEEGLSPASVDALLAAMLDSHRDLSESAALAVRFTLPVRRTALRSGESGWRHHPVLIEAESRGGAVRQTLTVSLEYSSTCPCSAALSRDLIDEAFAREFGDAELVPAADVRDWLETPGAIAGHPHSQRSVAELRADLSPDAADEPGDYPVLPLVDAAEAALGTAVQAAVKRIDEREFARLNAANPMFCEDAARRLARAVESVPGFSRYRVTVRHLESLHPHDAVAVASGPAS